MSPEQIANEIERTLEEHDQDGALQYFRAVRRIVGASEALRMFGTDHA